MDYIINNNLDLINIVVNHFNEFNISEELLYKIGYKGLIKAAIKFDIFVTYHLEHLRCHT